MPIPFYRDVRYTDDGCSIFECLTCKATWEWRGGSGPVRYCLFCGVEFRGQWECREQDTPRWMYELQQQSLDAQSRVRLRDRPRPPESYWVIEERMFRLNGELLRDWQPERSLYHHHGLTSHGAFQELQDIRQEFDEPGPMCRYEYRLVRKHDSKSGSQGCV